MEERQATVAVVIAQIIGSYDQPPLVKQKRDRESDMLCSRYALIWSGCQDPHTYLRMFEGIESNEWDGMGGLLRARNSAEQTPHTHHFEAEADHPSLPLARPRTTDTHSLPVQTQTTTTHALAVHRAYSTHHCIHLLPSLPHTDTAQLIWRQNPFDLVRFTPISISLRRIAHRPCPWTFPFDASTDPSDSASKVSHD